MTKSVVTLFEEASALEENDRATLAGLLFESIEAEPDPDVKAAWEVEIERRLNQLNSGEVDLIPWDEVKQNLYDKLEG